jgi:S1-C subfamily serine protease
VSRTRVPFRLLPTLMLVGAAFAQAAPGTAQETEATVVVTTATRGWLGLTYEVRPARPGSPGAVGTSRIVVRSLYRGGPAERFGLRSGDVIVRLNGAPARDALVRGLLTRLQPGDPIALTVLRGAEIVDLSLAAEARPSPPELLPRVVQATLDSVRVAFSKRLDSLHATLGELDGAGVLWRVVPEVHVSRVEGDSLTSVVSFGELDVGTVRLEQIESPQGFTLRFEVREGPVAGTVAPVELSRSVRDSLLVATVKTAPSWRPLNPYLVGANRVAGAGLRPLNAALGSYFGVERGLLVVEVAEGTPASEAGLLAGDVIRAVGERAVGSVSEFRAILSGSRGPATLGVIRRGRALELRLPG